MGKIIATNWISVDGYIAGPDGDLSWILGDDEMSDYELGLIGNADAVMLGGKTFREFAGFWPNVPQLPEMKPFEAAFAAQINSISKVAVSKALDSTNWDKTRFLRDVTVETITEVTEEYDRTIMYGSASILRQLLKQELLDELHLLVHPLLLGSGLRFFDGAAGRLNLTRLRSKPFESGVVLCEYGLK